MALLGSGVRGDSTLLLFLLLLLLWVWPWWGWDKVGRPSVCCPWPLPLPVHPSSRSPTCLLTFWDPLRQVATLPSPCLFHFSPGGPQTLGV